MTTTAQAAIADLDTADLIAELTRQRDQARGMVVELEGQNAFLLEELADLRLAR